MTAGKGRQASDTARAAVLAVNDSFYAAFRNADFAAMRELLADSDDTVLHRPEWPCLRGHADVLRCWYRLLVLATPPPVEALEESVVVAGRTALVVCREDHGGTELVTTNTWIRSGNAWKLLHHRVRPMPNG